MNCCRETTKMGVPPGNRRVLVSVPERYVAGTDTRGRQEGRPYPWSQQVIHEISGLEVILSGRCFRSLLSEYLLISIGSCKLARNSLTSLGSFSRFMIWVTLAQDIPSFLAISERVKTSPLYSISRHF